VISFSTVSPSSRRVFSLIITTELIPRAGKSFSHQNAPILTPNLFVMISNTK
jgi:hypothetical protein